ncbi:hypothetical protein ACRJ4W_51635 [Streptomyces sp. GLT-R25]
MIEQGGRGSPYVQVGARRDRRVHVGPGRPLRSAVARGGLRHGGDLAVHAGDEDTEVPAAAVLGQLDRVHLGLTQLAVQELDDRAQLQRNLVGDEQQPHLPGGQPLLDRRPELLRGPVALVVLVAEEFAVRLFQRSAVLDTGVLEGTPQQCGRPVTGGVRRVVQHLADDLTPDPGVRGPLDLHQGRHAVGVDEEMVQPVRRGTLGARRHPHLPCHQHQSQRPAIGQRAEVQHPRMTREQFLELRLGLEPGPLQGLQFLAEDEHRLVRHVVPPP